MGDSVGRALGTNEGTVGTNVGASDELIDGFTDTEGLTVGTNVGASDELIDGFIDTEGLTDGASDGLMDGFIDTEGLTVGTNVGEAVGDVVELAVGDAERKEGRNGGRDRQMKF